VVTTAEGGAVTTRNAELRERLRQFRNHGLVGDPEQLEQDEGGWHREQQVLGFNYRLSGVHSALGTSQLSKLAGFVDRRNAIAERYRESLADLEQIELPPQAPGGSLHAYHLFIIRHRAGAEARRRLYEGLHERGIRAQVHYVPVYLHPYYRDAYGYEPGLCPEAERYYAGCVTLPCFPALTDEEQRTVIEAVRELA
jgi:perosamine synthetase